jgi:hypothetical protein
MTEPENTTPVEPTDPVEEAPTEEPAKEGKGNGADAPAKALPKVMKLKLSELQMYKLAAHEERHERFKAELMEQLQRKYATQLAKEYAVLLNSSPNVVNSGKSLDATVNHIIAELEKVLPEGYAVTNLDASTCSATAEFSPGQRGQRLQ